MLDTLELRERLKEFSRLSVVAADKHRGTAQVDKMQKEEERVVRARGRGDDRGNRREKGRFMEGNSNVGGEEERMQV